MFVYMFYKYLLNKCDCDSDKEITNSSSSLFILTAVFVHLHS